MSPLTLRRYRAERLLKSQFGDLQGRVMASVAGRLRGAGVELDRGDLEACYAVAWQGLYAAVLEGQEIANPAGWLVIVTFRRAIEEHRSRTRAHRGGDHAAGGWRGESGSEELDPVPARDRDLAAELDDRVRLRQLFEGLRSRLSAREREAAVLCYLQGLPRAQAAVRLGVSEARMQKLMEGQGPGRPGVAGKIGALVEAIRDGQWCEQQGSLMRGLAFGILAPDGERHQLAVMHCSQCPACRAYVASLRGLAAALPPILLPGGLGAAALTGAGVGAGAGAGAGAVAGGAQSGAGAQLGRGVGGALGASGSAGGAAGGGWALAGGGKLALGCVLALSVGSGCIAINAGLAPSHRPRPVHRARTAGKRHPQAVQSAATARYLPVLPAPQAAPARSATRPATTARFAPGAKATREFGPEQALAAGAARPVVTALAGAQAPVASTASSARRAASSSPPTTPTAGPIARASGEAPSQAAREFSPG